VTSRESKPSRVCRACYTLLRLQSSQGLLKTEAEALTLQDNDDLAGNTARAITDPSTRTRGLLEVSHSDILYKTITATKTI